MYFPKGSAHDDHAGMMGQSAIPAQAEHTEQAPDAAFAEALAARDPAAWQRLFDEHYDRIYRYAWVRTRNQADAEDIAANVFAEAVRSIGSFRYRGTPVIGWLFRIAHNESVDLLKRRERQRTSPLDASAPLQAGTYADPAVRGEWRDVSQAMSALNSEQQCVLQLRLVEGRTVGEVAALMHKSEAAVKMMQMRALRTLRKRLGT
jgi:RNA polymerase sigma-70 factor (ECF subfamily)